VGPSGFRLDEKLVRGEEEEVDKMKESGKERDRGSD
jgi:hypothetical protein